jgi:zinc protease
MINDRLSELTQKENPPFIYGASSYEELFGRQAFIIRLPFVSLGKLKKG